MKKKLTLSIEESLVRKAKANSRKQGKSVSEFLEEAIEEATSEKKPDRKRWSEVWGGTLDLSGVAVESNDRIGHLVRRARTKAIRSK